MLSNIQPSPDLTAPRVEGRRRGWLFAVPLLSLGALVTTACGDGGAPPHTPPPPPTNLDQDSSPEILAAVAFFDDTRVHDVRLVMDPADWKSIVDDSRGDDWRTATFVIDGAVVTNVGVRPAGESSRVPGNPKMSMRVQFDAFREGMSVGGVDGVKLSGAWDDPFVFRDRLAYWYFRQKMPAPRQTAAVLTVNDHSTGSYEIEERWDRDAVKRHFPEPYGALYRMRGAIGADPFAYLGPDAASYVPLPWDPVGSHPSDDHLEIGRALAVLANDPANLDSVMNVDNLLDYFASNALLANTDGFTGDLEIDDFYEYYEPTSGQIFMLPWDPDNTFGSINDPPDRDIFQNYDKSAITRLIRDSAELRARFFSKLEEWMAAIPIDALDAQTDAIYQQIRPSVADDTLKQYPTEHFDWSLGYVKDFIAARYASVQAQIAAHRASSPPPPATGGQDGGDLPPAGGDGGPAQAGATP
jgi:hypothetical protein